MYQHATFEFALSGVSRQLVWCFLHAFPFYNTEQQSQRYVRLDEVRAVVPPELGGAARALYVRAVERRLGGLRRAHAPPRARDARHPRRALAPARAPVPRLRPQPAARGREERDRDRALRDPDREPHRDGLHRLGHHAAPPAAHGGRVRRALARRAASSTAWWPRWSASTRPSSARSARRPSSPRRRSRRGAAPAALGDPVALEAFDKSLGGRRSRLVDWGARAPEVVADAVRHVLGRARARRRRGARRWPSTRAATATGSTR